MAAEFAGLKDIKITVSSIKKIAKTGSFLNCAKA
jgi:hypothetical protein